MEYLDSLNPPQREGVINIDGPTMIIAGAGSGKTRVLTYRIAHLIRAGSVDPFSILALTFTNKAAAEMRHRIESVVGGDARNLWMGTFHSVFARILRSEAPRLGYPSNFTIYDTDDSKSLIKTIVKEMGLDDKLYKPNTVYNRISGAKNRLVSWREYLNNPIYQADDASTMRPEMGRIYKTYCERCYKAGAMDFDDLLFNTNVLFKEHLDVLNKYQQRFQYVMVDEFQDTNLSQYLITKKLAAVRQNICVVGDDAQSIYSFRGADITNILNFEKDYPDLKVIKLEQNYRSTKTIVNAANSVIAKNKSQLKKDVWTDNQEGELINLMRAATDNEEGRLIATSIFESKMQHQARSSEIAILYRTNSQSRAIEEALRKNNIKYKVVGGVSFYQRREIKDLIAYLRFTLNNNDEEALKRVINLPKRGIGPGSVNKIIIAAEEHSISLWEVITNIKKFMSGAAANAIEQFATMIQRFKIELQKKDAYEAAVLIAKESGMLRTLYEDKTIEGLSRYENVQELLNAIKEFVDSPDRDTLPNEDGEKRTGLEDFLQEVTLLTGQDNDKDDDGEKVTLMTIHMAKGLEYNDLYVAGLEEDLFPSQMMLSSREDLEEERRLFYVAITRAKKNLTLSFAATRYRFGRLKNCEPSRFLDEIDPRFIKETRKMGATEYMFSNRPGSNGSAGTTGRTSQASSWAKSYKRVSSQPKAKSSYTPPADFKASNTDNLQEGMKVEHPKFGYGKVVKMDETGANRKAKVLFDDFGEKTLLLSFAKLKIHDN